MSRSSILLLATALGVASAVPALAEGGDREPAGGAFMSSYSRSPNAAAGTPSSPYAAAAPIYAEPEATGSLAPPWPPPQTGAALIG